MPEPQHSLPCTSLPSCPPLCLQGLGRLEELVRKVVDLVDNRVESNLRAIANTTLVDLAADKSFTYDEFIATQARLESFLGLSGPLSLCLGFSAFRKATFPLGNKAALKGMGMCALSPPCPLHTHMLPKFQCAQSARAQHCVCHRVQVKFQQQQSKHLQIRNEEVRRSIKDLMQLVRTYVSAGSALFTQIGLHGHFIILDV